MSIGEIRFETSVPATAANDPSEPVEGAEMTDENTLQLALPKIETPTPKPTDERPTWLPEKFKSAEDLAKAYTALEKVKTPAVVAKIATEATPPTDLGFGIIGEEFAKTGSISEATLVSLEAKGLPRAMVSTYIAGQQALAEQQTAILGEDVGGSEGLKATLAWAGKNATPEEINGYNALIDAGNVTVAKILLKAIHQKYTDAMGNDPALVVAEVGGGASAIGGYASSAEMVTDMSNRRYTNDPAFRAMVEKRVGKSNF